MYPHPEELSNPLDWMASRRTGITWGRPFEFQSFALPQGEEKNFTLSTYLILSAKSRAMKLLRTIRYIFNYLPQALRLSPIIIGAVIAAEGVQHIVEWHLGMYQSQADFRANQSNNIRLAFGIVKAMSVVMACYFVPKKLSSAFGPPPKFGSFNKDMVRKLWDPRGGSHGLVAMLICAAPLIAVHYKLSELAMGHDGAIVLLVLDSVLIGLLALIMGTSVWAGDAVDANLAETLNP